MATTDATTGSSRIFISYRREDSDIWVGRLADELRKHFPAQRIFLDIASIDPGADFVTVLEQALGSAAAMLVVIGPRWLSATDRQGRKRLDSPSDFVRQEVAESLRRAGVRVFPLLVNGADMPAEEDLPEPLKPLARRQAFELTVRHWANDIAQFVVALKGVPGLSDEGTTEAAEATARLRAEQEAQRREPEESAAREEAQLAAAEKAGRRADEETRRKAAEDRRRKTEEEEETVRLRAKHEAQRREAEERATKEEAQRVAEEARKRADDQARRKAAEARRSAEEEARRRAAEDTVQRGAEPSHARPVLWKVVGISGIIGVAALAVFYGIGRSPDEPLATVEPPTSSSPIAPPVPEPALPEKASAVKDDLVTDGKVTRGRIGVLIQPITPVLAESLGLDTARGALINKVEPDSPAARAGLRNGDVVVEFNGKAITQPSDLPPLVAMVRPGAKATIKVWRDRSERALDVTVGDR